MNISQIFGKKVVGTSGRKGYVISVNASGDRVESFICADEAEEEFIIDCTNIKSYGNEIVFEDRQRALNTAKPVKLGRAAFDRRGKFLGFVEDVVLKGNKITSVKIGDKKYPAANIIFGDAAIVEEVKKLKSDVIKDGKVLIKKGTPVTREILQKAYENGAYIEVNLKSI